METRDWQDTIWPACSGVLFLRGRVPFCLPDGSTPGQSSGAPSALIAYGAKDATQLSSSELGGVFVTVQPRIVGGRLF